MSFVFCSAILFGKETETVQISRTDIEQSVKNLSEYQKNEQAQTTEVLLSLPKDELVKILRGYDQMQKIGEEQADMGLDFLVLNAYYTELKEKPFADEKERKKFEQAVQKGVLAGVNDTKSFAVIMIEKEMYIIPSTLEGARQLMIDLQESFEQIQEKYAADLQKFQLKLEEVKSSADKIIKEAERTQDQKKKEQLAESVNAMYQKVQEEMSVVFKNMLDEVCDQYFQKLGVGFFYDILLVRLAQKASKTWMPDVIKQVKAKRFKK